MALRQIVLKCVVFFVVLLVVNECYVLFDSYALEGQDLQLISLTRVGDALSAVGGIVPKAASYAEYFSANAKNDLAKQLLRVNGFCLTTFVLAVCFCAGSRVLFKDRSKEFPISIEERLELTRVQRVVIMAGVIHIFQTFMGFGLSTRSVYLAESITGANVIINPVASFPFLFVVIFYLASSQRYLSHQVSDKAGD
jgi:hypothetical protein